jgi:hypothetical protein
LRHVQIKHPGRESHKDNKEAVLDITITERLEGSLGFQLLIKTTINVNKFRYYLLRWIMKKQVLFKEVEDKDFREILRPQDGPGQPDGLLGWAGLLGLLGHKFLGP